MLLQEFPNLTWLHKQIRENFQDQRSWNGNPLPEKGWPTILLNAKTRKIERTDVKGPFSIFMNLKGRSKVGLQNKQIEIHDNAFVMTNLGQSYDLLIDEPEEATECLNIHFENEFYFSALKTLNQNSDFLLSNPFYDPKEAFSIPFRAIFRTKEFNRIALKTREVYQNPNFHADEKEETLFHFFSFIFKESQHESNRLNFLKASRSTTRQEIMKRLSISLDFIYANLNQQMNLDQLSQIAAMSKFHYLRCFKDAFQQSPYQFIKRLRIDFAIDLIQNSSNSLSEIAEKVGLENGSSLSRMIFNSTGIRPSLYKA